VTVPDAVRDMESAPFFDGTARGELMIKRCDACGHRWVAALMVILVVVHVVYALSYGAHFFTGAG